MLGFESATRFRTAVATSPNALVAAVDPVVDFISLCEQNNDGETRRTRADPSCSYSTLAATSAVDTCLHDTAACQQAPRRRPPP